MPVYYGCAGQGDETMPLDGIVIANIVSELKNRLLGGKVDKIYQPERDGIVMLIRNKGENHKLFITASASHPRLHITSLSRPNPDNAPQFCMLLRKTLSGGRVTDIIQPEFERIVIINIESSDEMGDISLKSLIVEIMGKHSNIILIKDGIILDSIKRVPHEKSSVREVLPRLPYVLPPSKDKKNPIKINDKEFFELLSNKNEHIETSIYTSYNGISPAVASEIASRAGVFPQNISNCLSVSAKTKLFTEFLKIMAEVVTERFTPEVYLDEKNKAIDFSSIKMTVYSNYNVKPYESISFLLDEYYQLRDAVCIKAQKSSDLKKLITQNLERCAKKRDIQHQTMKEIKDRDKYKLYGELLTANIYELKTGMTTVRLSNFYDENGAEVEIPLDSSLSPSENAQKYFKKYNKEKRTYQALLDQMKQNDAEKDYLDQLLATLETCEDEADLADLRRELYEEGYIKKANKKKETKEKKSKPLHFISSDGFDIYVGKNNKQNEELTLKFASNSDMWLHTKSIPGSHVIIKTNGNEVPDRTLNEGALLACYYSKGRNSQHVPVDYTVKKNVKKPSGAKTGMVIYENYKTAFITTDESMINGLKRVL